jgi:hypothetical protein
MRYFQKLFEQGNAPIFLMLNQPNDYYLTITESKKSTHDGVESYQKHKIFLYKEDFAKFHNGLSESISAAQEKLIDNGEDISIYPTVGFDEL